MENNFRSDLSKAKNLGSASSGSGHWLMQRFSAVFLLVTTIWFLYFSYSLSSLEPIEMVQIIQIPYNITMIALLVLVAFYHSTLGMQIIIEDYIKSRLTRIILILSLKIFSIITACSFVVAVLYAIIL